MSMRFLSHRRSALHLMVASLLLFGIEAASGPRSLINPANARDDTKYNIGRLVSYARACALHGIASDISLRFKNDRDFKAGEHDGDLGGWDIVRGLQCGKIEEILIRVKNHLAAGGAKKSLGPRSYESGQSRSRSKGLDPQLAEIAPPRSTSGAELQISTNATAIKTARSTILRQYEDHAQKWAFDYEAAQGHKAVSVCVRWSVETGAIRPNENEAPRPSVMQSFWQSGSKDRTTAIVDSMAQCLAWREGSANKGCHCQQLKADEDTVLTVPSG